MDLPVLLSDFWDRWMKLGASQEGVFVPRISVLYLHGHTASVARNYVGKCVAATDVVGLVGTLLSLARYVLIFN